MLVLRRGGCARSSRRPDQTLAQVCFGSSSSHNGTAQKSTLEGPALAPRNRAVNGLFWDAIQIQPVLTQSLNNTMALIIPHSSCPPAASFSPRWSNVPHKLVLAIARFSIRSRPRHPLRPSPSERHALRQLAPSAADLHVPTPRSFSIAQIIAVLMLKASNCMQSISLGRTCLLNRHGGLLRLRCFPSSTP